MALTGLFHYRNADSTADLNSRFSGLIQKGVYDAGTTDGSGADHVTTQLVSPSTGLNVSVLSFLSVGTDGMGVVHTGPTILPVQADLTQYIVLRSVYNGSGAADIAFEVQSNAAWTAMIPSEKAKRIILAKVTLLLGAVAVTQADIDLRENDLIDRQTRFFIRGVVAAAANLPIDTVGVEMLRVQDGDVYLALAERQFYQWNGAAWETVTDGAVSILLNLHLAVTDVGTGGFAGRDVQGYPAHPASAVRFDTSGTFVATTQAPNYATVQEALVEIDAEKVKKAGDTMTGQLSVQSVASADAVVGTGTVATTRSGVAGTGGSAGGAGVSGTGGATSGIGVAGTGGAPNGPGTFGTGTGTGDGVVALGEGGTYVPRGGVGLNAVGDTGKAGAHIEGGADAVGAVITGTGSNGAAGYAGATITGATTLDPSGGNGVVLQGGDGANFGGDGVSATGGGGAVSGGNGVYGVGGVPNGRGVGGTGDGTGAGGSFEGGPTSGVGVNGVGGAPNGIGVTGTGTGSGAGGTFTSGDSASAAVVGDGASGAGAAGGSFTGSATGAGTAGVGVVAFAGGATKDGVRGSGLTTGNGVFGETTGAGAGVKGVASANVGSVGVLGTATSGASTYGVRGSTDQATSFGVYGATSNATGIGGFFEATGAGVAALQVTGKHIWTDGGQAVYLLDATQSITSGANADLVWSDTISGSSFEGGGISAHVLVVGSFENFYVPAGTYKFDIMLNMKRKTIASSTAYVALTLLDLTPTTYSDFIMKTQGTANDEALFLLTGSFIIKLASTQEMYFNLAAVADDYEINQPSSVSIHRLTEY